MKTVLFTSAILFGVAAFADRPYDKPVQTIRHDFSSTSLTSAAYVELDSALNENVTAFTAFNSCTSPIRLAIGAAASEVEQAFMILPNGALSNKDVEPMSKGSRLSMITETGSCTSGELILNLMQKRR